MRTAARWLFFNSLLVRGGKEQLLATKEEFDCFLANVERRAFRMCEYATANPDDAFDLMQDTAFDFVRRYRQRPAEEWSVLYFRILQSRITDWHRRSIVRNRFRVWFGKRDEEDAEDQLQNLPDRYSPDPAESLVRRDMTDRLHAALRGLPLRQRQAFLLRAWEGMSVEQTASVMGCSAGSVKTHYFRAIQVLRQLLEEFRP